jgi:soluble lytic murein transglycosylase
MSNWAPVTRARAWMVVVLASLPSAAEAWAGEPLCAFPESEVWAFDQPPEPSGDGDSMCLAYGPTSSPHLLRAPMSDSCAPMSGRTPEGSAREVAAKAYQRARELEARGQVEEAVLSLRVVESNLPRIADHVALLRAGLFERMNDPGRAAQAYSEAVHSINGDLAARAQVGRVENLLRALDPGAQTELDQLLRKYPHLPEAARLKLALADYRAARGEVRTAISTYRMLDLSMPGYPVAHTARERLKAMAAEGHVIAPYSVTEQLARAAKLVQTGPVELAREAVAGLESLRLTKAQATQRELMVLDLVDSTGELHPDVAAADPELERAASEKRLAAALAKKKLTKLRPAQLYMSLQEATRIRATSVADPLVAELTKRGMAAPADVRFGALSAGAGTVSDQLLAELAATLVDHPTLGPAARYHRARALERLGQKDAARVELEEVTRLDRSTTRFYANFAAQRLRAMDGAAACPAGRATECNRERIEVALNGLEYAATPDVKAALAHVAAVESEHGAGFPWLGRALDLLALGESAAAADELYETYLAFRGAARRGSLNAGRMAVYRGAGVMRLAPDMATRRARLSLDGKARLELAHAASKLGDWGTATYFGGSGWAETHPHPYAHEVAAAARKHGLDPDLLFAVMRVESVYQRRIISHAGAVGLMQIMPRTGRLIADKVGRYDATTTDLLDPRTNLEFSAWYLKSLLERMDGRLPLAIASYNGGPHNVRKWMRREGEHMPLDAFLERIPFTETKRYVRRVLGYYTRYKAARGELVDPLAMTLPTADKPNLVQF